MDRKSASGSAGSGEANRRENSCPGGGSFGDENARRANPSLHAHSIHRLTAAKLEIIRAKRLFS
jgi:hypothetical protein